MRRFRPPGAAAQLFRWAALEETKVDEMERSDIQKKQALRRLLESLDDTEKCTLSNVESWLDDDEELREFTSGVLVQPATEFDYAIVLTSRHLRAVSICDEMKIELGNIKCIKWSGLWARLNVELKSTRKRMVFAISGREWKKRARILTEEWSRLSV